MSARGTVLALVASLLAALLLAGGGAALAQGHDHAGHDHAGHDHAGHDHAGHDHAGHDQIRAVRGVAVTPPRTTAGVTTSDDLAERAVTTSKPVALLFWCIALMVIGGAIFVITRSNLITAVMGMVFTFFGVAVLYLMLFAPFMAVIQLLVYAGAIMVLFVFVIMILNKPESEPWGGSRGMLGRVAAVGAMVYLVVRLAQIQWKVTPADPALLAAPPDWIGGPLGQTAYPFGSTAALGDTLYRDYLFPFEAVSLVLLVAVVGAIAIARRSQSADPAVDPITAGDPAAPRTEA